MLFVLKSTHQEAINLNISLNARLLAATVKNMNLEAKLKAYRKCSAPIKNKDGKWIDPKTSQFVKSPVKQEMEAQLRREASLARQQREGALRAQCDINPNSLRGEVGL